jgi:hypothetical protein
MAHITTTREVKERSMRLRTLANPTLYGGGVNKIYWRNVIVYGQYAELREYNALNITWKRREGERKDVITQNKRERHDFSVARARQNIYRLVEANVSPRSQFFTLTFKENVKDLATAHRYFSSFIRRLKRKYGSVLYVVVPEFQKRGAVHYHGVFFNLPPLRKFQLEYEWGQGFADISFIRDIKSVGAYLAKYLGKDVKKMRKGKKSYFASRGLKRPIELWKSEDIDFFFETNIIEKIASKSAGNYTFIKYRIFKYGESKN